VVALSGHVVPSHTDRARDVGYDTILPKPCHLTDVADKIPYDAARFEAAAVSSRHQ